MLGLPRPIVGGVYTVLTYAPVLLIVAFSIEANVLLTRQNVGPVAGA